MAHSHLAAASIRGILRGVRTPRYPIVCRPLIRAWLGLVAVLFLGLIIVRAGEASLPAGRLVGTFDGIKVEYSPGQEELARLLGQRLAAHNHAMQGKVEELTLADATIPLSPADLRMNRARYLAAISAQLALKQATPWQEECYDAFLDTYDRQMRLLAHMRQVLARSAGQWDRVTLWDRDELVHRLEGGETIVGFTWDPVKKKGSSDFNMPRSDIQDDALKEIAARQEKLRHDYRFKMSALEDGGTNYQATTSWQKKPAPEKPVVETAPAIEKPKLEALPVVIPQDLAGLPAADLVEKLWETKIEGLFKSVTDANQKQPKIDPTIAFLVLHETTEIGILDHYYRGKDRRWFCDGIANYVPWRVVRDLHGSEAARSVYDLGAQLAKFADLREEADLRKWPATENQTEGEKETRLNRARYAFAARVVFLMNERAGEDILPRLFTEIGKTKPNKVSMKTVEQAWKKTAGTKLDAILAEAVTAPAAAASAP